MQYVDQLPLPVPSRTDPANFSVRGDNFLGALPDYSTQLNALATEVNAANVAAESSKNLAKTSEINAQASAFAAAGSANSAASSSGAALWVSGTTYAIGDLRYSPANGRTYRRKTAGAGTTDPSLDTTNWYPVLLEVSTLYPNIRPSLNLDFINSKQLDPRITFTRSTTAKYFDGKTYHKAEENLLTYSEQLGDAAWNKSGLTTTNDATISPAGTSSAELMTETATTGQHTLYQNTGVIVGNVYTFSVYAKYSTRQFIQLIFDNSSWSNTCYANFDIQNGVLGTAGAGVTASIISVGNGWYRCSITSVAGASVSRTSCPFYVLTSNSSSAGYYPSFTGSVSNSVYLWGTQVEQRSSLGPYVATTTQPVTNYQMTLVDAAVNQPRFDHDPVTGEQKGLFIEDATTNLLTYSEDLTNAAWTKTGSTISPETIFSLSGSKTACKLVESAVAGYHHISMTYSVSNGVTYSFSFYVKRSGQNAVYVELAGAGFGSNKYAVFDLANGVLGTLGTAGIATIQNCGNDWYRCSVTTVAESSSTGNLRIYIARNATDANPSYTGDGYSGVYIWGAQLEANAASPSSYVATTSGTSARAYDSAQLTGNNFSSWYNQQEGSILAEVKMDQKPLSGYFNNRWFTLDSGSSSNSIYSMFDSTGILRSYIIFNDNTTASLTSGSWTVGEIYKSTIAFASDNFAGCFNSGTVSTDNSGVLPKNLTTCYIGTGAAFLRGYIRKFQYYPKRLSNTELQALSAL